jgi:translocator protein
MIPIFSGRSLIFLAIALLIVAVASATGGFLTYSKIPVWYAGLNKPWFNPPRQAFGIVWPMLYGLMALGFWRILRNTNAGKPRDFAIFTFIIQILFNVGWSFAFFAAQSPAAGVMVAIGLVLAVLSMVLAFRKVDALAALLQLPYLAWVSFALILNTAIWQLN